MADLRHWETFSPATKGTNKSFTCRKDKTYMTKKHIPDYHFHSIFSEDCDTELNEIIANSFYNNLLYLAKFLRCASLGALAPNRHLKGLLLPYYIML